MDRLLARLERRYGKFAIENLTMFVVGGMAMAYVAWSLRPAFEGLLLLDLSLVGPPHWQVWRLVSYLFIPPSHSLLWVALDLYFVWLIGSNLEHEWGAFKFNAYYVIGIAGTTLAAALTSGVAGNTFLNISLFLAFATLFPDFQILLFFILPVKVKWLAWVAVAYALYLGVIGDSGTRAAIAAATANYQLFFGPHLWRMFKSRNLQVRQAARRTSIAPTPVTGTRVCAICGAKEQDGADIRVCSCAKCGGPRTLCLTHARNH
jgi:hypothetical protein